MGGTAPHKLHVVFFPFMAAGHMIPILDIAKLFAAHNVKTTIITTPLNAQVFIKPLERYKSNGPKIDIEIVPFPSKEVGLPEGLENLDQTSPSMTPQFLQATQMLQEPLEQVLKKHKPNCLVADMLLPFATQVAATYNIPRLVFHGTCFFALCVSQAFITYEPHKSNDDEEFVIPHLPHEIKMTKLQLPENMKVNKNKQDGMVEFFIRAMVAEAMSHGVIVNSFYELEPDYADHYRKVMGRRAWHIGPVSLCNRENQAKFQRGKDSSVDEHECLKWLDSRKPNSVVYICFGSMSMVSTSQLHEIAKGLEASRQDFIWVVSQSKDHEITEDIEEWLPDGFEKRMEGKGLIIRGWAPQILILEHEAIGAFVTHCGWNSTLEGISCGVPLVTWPMFAEQFYNEKLVTEVLKTGIAIGATQWNRIVEGSVKCEDIKKAIERIMVGEEALGIRSKANKLKEMARNAIVEGGSSYTDLNSLIEDLGSYHGSWPEPREDQHGLRPRL